MSYEDAGSRKNLDEFIKLGRYCILVFICVEFIVLTTLTNMVFMVYAGLAPTIPLNGSDNFNQYLSNLSLPKLTAEERCDQFQTFISSHVREQQFESVNVEFKLLCYKESLVKHSISIQMVGVLIGSVTSGPCSDAYGRKTVLLVALLCGGFFSLMVSYSSTFLFFTITQAVVGFFTGALITVERVFLVENTPKKHRFWACTLVSWVPNFVILPFIAYLCGNWRTLSKFSAAVSIVGFLTLLVLEESPRWRIHEGQIDKARQSLRRIRKIDGSTCETEGALIEQMLKHEKEQYDAQQLETSCCQVLQLLKSKKHLVWGGTLCYGMSVASMLHYSIMFNMERLSGSIYWNNVISGIVGFIIAIAIGVADYSFEWVGRKTVNCCSIVFFVPGLCILSALHYTERGEDYSWLKTYISLGTAAMTCTLMMAKIMMTSELFPTSVRSTTTTAITVFSRFGAILAPQLFHLTKFHASAPYIVLLVLYSIDFIIFRALLPETKGKNLQNSLPVKKHKVHP